MKAFAQKTGSVLLAFLLLFSTLSFTMDMHFCGKTLVDFEIFHEAEGCGMSMDDSLMTEMGCCSDVEIAVFGQDDLKFPQWDSLKAPLQVFVAAAAAYLPQLLAWEPDAAFIPFKEYSPPLLIRDLPVNYGVFLI